MQEGIAVPVTFMCMLYMLQHHINMDWEQLKKLWVNDGMKRDE